MSGGFVSTNIKIRAIADQIPKRKKRLIDVGCDHAKLCIYAIQQEIVPEALALDIHEKPVQKALTNIRYFNLEDKITVKQQDGLKDLLLTDTDVVVIAGMGGLEIKKILQQARIPSGVRLILHPTKSIFELRQYLYTGGYQCLGEELVFQSNRLHSLIILESRANYQINYTDLDCFIGLGFQDKIQDENTIRYFNGLKLEIKKKQKSTQNKTYWETMENKLKELKL